MNKTELIKKIVEKTGYTQRDVREVLDTKDEIIMATLASGEEVKAGIETYVVKDTKPRKARNLRTGETIDVPASRKVSIKLSKALKESVK